ncbi:MAG TPA: TetR/AcrR family transcriptional regulator [Solirubrobacterales bacterium]|jgi:AcrR family transcriptional regulator|nr:TetR/AcrR family transcriptional regulator [Solirubrobacterales bacterium]
MIELVAQQGYKAVKVRELVRLASVSTRTFYERFESKEDCLLQTYDAITRGATKRIFDSQADASDPRDRQSLIIRALMRELKSGPEAARLVLVDAPDASSAALEHVRRAERSLEARFSECLARPPGGILMPPLVVEGVVAGVIGTVRSWLLADRGSALDGLQDELANWALCYPSAVAVGLAELDGKSVWRNTAFEPLSMPIGSANGMAADDRALILAAVAELSAGHDYANLTTARVRARSGVTRRKFETHFVGIEDCFLASLELRSREALAQITRAKAAGRTWPGGIYRSIVALSDHVARDRFLAKICLHEDLGLGARIAKGRQHLIATLIEQLVEGAPDSTRQGRSFTEATASAVWTLFCRYVLGDSGLKVNSASTLAYIALAPTIGASAAMTSISEEQAPSARD